MLDIRFSVVVPLYNKGDQVVRAVQSILEQTYPAQEILVIDDGSTDLGPDLVSAMNEPKIQVISQSNQGESAARNTGVSIATSKYVAFLDADDWWEPNHLESLAALLQVAPEANLLSTGHKVLRNGSFFPGRSKFEEGWKGLVPNFLREYANNLALINSTTACVEREALVSIGGFPVGVNKGPDVITWINMGLKFPVAHVEMSTAVYNQDGLNRTDKIKESEAPGSLIFLSELINEYSYQGKDNTDLRYLFRQIAFFTSGGYALLGNRSGLRSIRKLVFQTGEFTTAIKIFILSLSPRFILNFARSVRNSQ